MCNTACNNLAMWNTECNNFLVAGRTDDARPATMGASNREITSPTETFKNMFSC